MFFLLMAACGASEDYLDFDTGAVESVQCTHPVSVYEAQIKASILPVKDDWDAIEFIVSQDGEHWLTHLRKPDDDGTWSTVMNIYDFDCYGVFHYDFIVGDY